MRALLMIAAIVLFLAARNGRDYGAVLILIVLAWLIPGCATPAQQALAARERQLCRADRDDQLRRLQQLGMRCASDDCRALLAVEYRYVKECE